MVLGKWGGGGSEAAFGCVAQAGPQLEIFQLQPPEGWDDRPANRMILNIYVLITQCQKAHDKHLCYYVFT